MIQSASQYQISDIFSIDTKVKYVIPKFQREYIWGKEQWENLFDDLMENEKGHFIGSIICINKGRDVLDITPLEIIDGQQRLATISLLYAAIYKKFLQEERDGDDFVTERINLKSRLINRSRKATNKTELKIELSHQNNNFVDYKAVLNEINLYSEISTPLNLGNRQIYKTFRYFKNRISSLKYKELLQVLERINSALLVKIEVSTHADAFTLFESLNNRGIPLSAIDLVKNNMLAELEKKKIKSIDDAFDEWMRLIDNLPGYSIQERFLRQYYNAFRYRKEIKVPGIARATRSNLIKIYDKLISKNTEFIFKELIDKSEKYNQFVESNNNKNGKFKEELVDLLHIGAAPSYAFLLYLFTEHERNRKLIRDSIKFLAKYFVRRNLTDIPPTRELDSIFMDLIDLCEKNKNDLTSDIVIEFLRQKNRFENNESFKEKLMGDIYADNVAAARFILTKIEEKHQTKEIYRDFWEKDDKSRFLWTIEHVFPAGKNIPKEWIDMIAGGNGEEAKELQEKSVHKLGNLTLTAYNPNLSNFSFIKKKNRQDTKGRFIGYRNGLFLNKRISRKKTWRVEDIQDRTNHLVELALKLFS